MPTAPTPASQSGSEVLLQAAALLSHWEQARPAGSAPLVPELRTALNQFMVEVLSGSQETNLYISDIQKVLSEAAGLATGRAEASGPGRSLVALQSAYHHMQAVEPCTAIHGRILLCIQSRPDVELKMDELTEITETLLRNTGQEWELIFGYGVVPNLPAEIRLTFLLAPSANEKPRFMI